MTHIVVASRETFTTDYLNSKYQSKGLDGDVLIDKIRKKNIHTTLIGIINFSSSHSSSCKKKGFFLKTFSPFFSSFQNVWVRTDKIIQTSDLYAQVTIDWDKSTDARIECCVDEYMNNVSEFNNEPRIINMLATSHWSNKINKIIIKCGEYDECKNRTDFTDVLAYSIDPPGCVDIDDALHYKKLNNTHHEIGIHIADVTSYFPLNSVVWKEMSNRVETVYYPSAIHMYPPEFSTQIASLIEGKKSRSFSLIVTVDNNYNIVNTKFCRGLVKVKNMTYDNANISVDPNIKQLFNIARELRKTLLGKECIDSHELVETFMILANNEAAKFIVKSDLYKLNKLIGLIRIQDSDNMIQLPQGLLNDNVYERVKHLRVQRAMYKYYSKDASNRHFGLNLDIYTHFTSPIRRYSDILVHQTINAIIESNVDLLPVITIETIFKLNYYKNYYKKCIIYNNEIELASNMKNSFEDMECTIVDIYDNKCRVLAESYGKKFIFDVDIFYKKIANAINTEYTTTSITLSTEHSSQIISLTIGSNVTIRVCYIPLKLKKIKSYIIVPDIYDSLFI